VVERPQESSHADDFADLRRQLEQVVKPGRPSETVGSIRAQHSRRRWESLSLTPSPPRQDPTPSFKSGSFLAARYDFAPSLRTPWRVPSVSEAPSNSRTNTNPSSRLNSVPWPQSPRVACGSPRDKTEISLLLPDHDPDRDHDSDDAIILVPSLRRSSSGCGSRNYIRGGTIVLSHGPAVKRTPPTSPFGSPVLPTVPLSTPTPPAHSQAPPYPRFNSFPPHSSSKDQHLSQDWISGASEESTPSITNSSSSSPSRSPSLSSAEPLSPTRFIPPGVDIDGKSNSPIHNLDYLNLVNRYVCQFYSDILGPNVDVLPQLLLLHRVGT
jgi:hypothetical protein